MHAGSSSPLKEVVPQHELQGGSGFASRAGRCFGTFSGEVSPGSQVLLYGPLNCGSRPLQCCFGGIQDLDFQTLHGSLDGILGDLSFNLHLC